MLSAPTTRRGDWFQTFTGRQFYALDPRVDDLDIADIAHALSLLCRFNGHVKRFYSVAEHSVRVARVVVAAEPSFRPAMVLPAGLAGLMHDAAEAYLGDMVRPLKRQMPEYRAAENLVEAAIAARFALTSEPEVWARIKRADFVLLATERRDLLPHRLPWMLDDENVVPLTEPVEGWSPERAEQEFLDAFHLYGGAR